MQKRVSFLFLLFLTVISACTGIKETRPINNKGFHKSQAAADSIVAHIPNYRHQLSAVKGKGKALISEPKHSKRLTLYFSSNRKKSLITAKNGIGIEAGKLLTDGDSLLIYNKVDKYVRKISLKNRRLSDINNLASVNILKLLHATVSGKPQSVKENVSSYLLQMQSGRRVYVSKKTNRIQQINEPPSLHQPYSQIIYDAYARIKGFTLPRRITIFNADRSAKVDLLIQSLEINPSLGKLTIDYPDDIKVYHQ